MRKFVVVMFVGFTASVFAVAGTAARRARGRGHAASAASNEPPQSPQIAQELGGPQGIQWGWSHDQVIDYYRRALQARYQPLLRNKGQVEQDQLLQQRDRVLDRLRSSYIPLDGRRDHTAWDTSFLADEYTHHNGESLMVYEDPQTGNREFFLFFNDHLWKRFQARAVPPNSNLDYAGFLGAMEGLFGHGLHLASVGPNHSDIVVWQDGATRLHVIDQSTFYNVFCLVYEEKATLGRLAELRRNMPTKTEEATSTKVSVDESHVGNVEGDPNADIVDRITGKMRHTQTGPTTGGAQGGNGSTGASGGTGTSGSTPPSGSQPAHGNGNGNGNGNNADDDPLRGL